MASVVRYVLRSDTATNWESKNPVLLLNEIRYKMGDSKTAWKNLPYVKPDVINDLVTGGTIDALSAEQGKVLKGLVDGKASTTDLTNLETKLTQLINGSKVTVENNLTSTSTTNALSANQGRILNGKIPSVVDNLTSTSTVNALSANQGRILNQLVNTLKIPVEDNLTSTSATRALSANQGRVLKGLVDGKPDTSTVTQLINDNKINVENSLLSRSTTDALSAYQGYVLNALIDRNKITVEDSLSSSSRTNALSAYSGYWLAYWKLQFVTDIDEEEWTFTLENGTTITKKVALWTEEGSSKLAAWKGL